MPKKRMYGNYNDETNKFVIMIPYCIDFLEEYAKSSRPHVFHRVVEFGIYCNQLQYFKQTKKTAITIVQKKKGDQEIKEFKESEEYKKWFEKNYFKEYILNVNTPESHEYFKNIVNKKPIKKTTKQRYYYFIDKYFNFVRDWKKTFENNDTFKNPLPALKLCRFKGTSQTQYEINMNYRGPDLQSITRILTHIYYVVGHIGGDSEGDYRIFVALSLIIYSGARIEEVCHIDLQNLKLKERWFKTKVKSRLSERDGWYFFPEFFVLELKEYIKKRNKDYPNSTFLFPARNSYTGYLAKRTIQGHLQKAKEKLGLKIATNSHAFRDFLNTQRKLQGLKRGDRKKLLNQKTGDVNIENYLKIYNNKINLRSLYDEFNPYPELIKPEDPKL